MSEGISFQNLETNMIRILAKKYSHDISTQDGLIALYNDLCLMESSLSAVEKENQLGRERIKSLNEESESVTRERDIYRDFATMLIRSLVRDDEFDRWRRNARKFGVEVTREIIAPAGTPQHLKKRIGKEILSIDTIQGFKVKKTRAEKINEIHKKSI